MNDPSPEFTPDDPDFPSCPWIGFYNHVGGGTRHRQELGLMFRTGRMTGTGHDDVGAFSVRGDYDPATRKVSWLKTYPGSHVVFYRGFREGKGIWGTWEIPPRASGGFHIWPKGLGEEASESVEADVPVDALQEPSPVPVPAGIPDRQSHRPIGNLWRVVEMFSLRPYIAMGYFLCVATASAWAQGRVPDDSARIDAAVARGKDHLLGLVRERRHGDMYRELILYTLLHAGAQRDGEEFRLLLDGTLDGQFGMTYRAALAAMALRELGSVEHRQRIAECAQYLADNQCENGQWTYGKPVPLFGINPTSIIPRARGGPKGDNSNSQFAAMGLRACVDAGITIDRGILERGRDWWLTQQCADGGWSYSMAKRPPYRSIATAGIAAVAAYGRLLKDPKCDAATRKGLQWLEGRFSVEPDPTTTSWHYAYLYSVERVGALCGVVKVGKHDWYREGAAWLIDQQLPDGSWGRKTEETCFAILFLRKATQTRPITYSKSVRPSTAATR